MTKSIFTLDKNTKKHLLFLSFWLGVDYHKNRNSAFVHRHYKALMN